MYSTLRKKLKKPKFPRVQKKLKCYVPPNLGCLALSFSAPHLVKVHPCTKHPTIALLGKGMGE